LVWFPIASSPTRLHEEPVFEDEGFYPWVDLAVSPDDRWILTVKQPLPVSELMLMENFR
jgi:hypothetical protein